MKETQSKIQNTERWTQKGGKVASKQDIGINEEKSGLPQVPGFSRWFFLAYLTLVLSAPGKNAAHGKTFHWKNLVKIKRQESGSKSPAGTQIQMSYKR